MAQATQFKLDATKPFYALAGTADLAVERARKVATEVQTQLDEALTRVSKVEADPKVLGEIARKQVTEQLDAVLKEAKLAQIRIESRFTELQAELRSLLGKYEARAAEFRKEIEKAFDEQVAAFSGLASRGETAVAKVRGESVPQKAAAKKSQAKGAAATKSATAKSTAAKNASTAKSTAAKKSSAAKSTAAKKTPAAKKTAAQGTPTTQS